MELKRKRIKPSWLRDRTRSDAPTKRGRRRENWGPARIKPTVDRRIAAYEDHLPPANMRDRRGQFWRGARDVPARKRDAREQRRARARRSWRKFYRPVVALTQKDLT